MQMMQKRYTLRAEDIFISERKKMYLHLGENKIIQKCDIIGIFDSDTATMSKVTRKLLTDAEKAGQLESVGDLPKSFTLTSGAQGEKIYFSQLSVKTLIGRATENDN